MTIEGAISIFVNENITTIQVRDENAATQFLEIKLTAEQFCAALGRFANVKCDIDVYQIDKVGKYHENKYFTFEIPKELRASSNEKKLHEIAQKLLDEQGEGWVADCYFSSQNSFYTSEGKEYARCIIRRWTDINNQVKG